MKINMLFVIGLLFAAFILPGCYADAQVVEPIDPSTIDTVVEFPAGDPYNGCTIIVDQLGEREACSYYYLTDAGVIWWDSYFHVWVAPHGYWANGIYYRGYWPGYIERYRTTYHAYGWHARNYGWWSNGESHNGRVEPGFRAAHPYTYRSPAVNMHRSVSAPHGSGHHR